MHEEELKKIQDVLDVKTGQIVQYFNREKARNYIRENDRDRGRTVIRKKR